VGRRRPASGSGVGCGAAAPRPTCDRRPGVSCAGRVASFALCAGSPHSAHTVDALVGRPAELAALDALFERLATGVAGVRLEGDPGIGRSAVWQEGVRRAADRGLLVLTARPTEAEAAYAFAGLGDLLGDVDGRLLAALPIPQRQALEAALLVAEDPGGGIEERAIGAGLLSVLRALAAERPTLVAVDDVRWLDEPTGRVLAFALRRLRTERVGLLVAARAGTSSQLDRALPPERLQRIVLGPLSVGALHVLFKQHLGHSFPRPVLGRIARACDGNPLYSLEIARELERTPEPGPVLPVPAALGSLVEERVARLLAVT
jgi:AAA ATPase domain